MNERDALNILWLRTRSLRLTRRGHEQVAQALNVLESALKKKKGSK